MPLTDELYQIAAELRGQASLGLRFDTDPYSIERCRKVLACSARIVAAVEGRSHQQVLADYEDNLSHISPLAGAEAVVWQDDKLLLIQRADNGLWAVPGGLVEVGETLAGAAERELAEEAGVSGRAVALLAVFDSRFWGSRSKSHLYHVAFRVQVAEPVPAPGPEALAAGFFAEGQLPALSPGHDVRIPLLFRQRREEVPVPYFDGLPTALG